MKLLVAVIAALTLTSLHAQSSPAELFAQHDWFGLADRAAAGVALTTVQTTAMTCGFHRADCPAAVDRALQTTLGADDEYELREALSSYYFRAGRYRATRSQMDRMRALRPEAADIRNAQPLIESLAEVGDQVTSRVEPSTLPVTPSDSNFPLPIRVNGKSAHYLFDTGANLSVLSESEARRLGLTIRAVTTRMSNTAGDTVAIRVATADTIDIGRAHLEHVAFVVLGDDQAPFDELPQTQRGAIGLPVLLALGAFSWGPDGVFAVAPSPHRTADRTPMTLAFDGALPIVRGTIEGRPVSFNLDSGAEETILWPAVARDFPDLLTRVGVKRDTEVNGFGSSSTIEAVELSRLNFTLAGANVSLKNLSTLLRGTTTDTKRRWGNIGLDALNQSRRTLVDFRTMHLTLTPK